MALLGSVQKHICYWCLRHWLAITWQNLQWRKAVLNLILCLISMWRCYNWCRCTFFIINLLYSFQRKMECLNEKNNIFVYSITLICNVNKILLSDKHSSQLQCKVIAMLSFNRCGRIVEHFLITEKCVSCQQMWSKTIVNFKKLFHLCAY